VVLEPLLLLAGPGVQARSKETQNVKTISADNLITISQI